MSEKKKIQNPLHLAGSIVCIILIIALSIVLIGNVTFIIKGALHPDTPPTVFGVVPLVALSGSMDGDHDNSFGAGSMVIMKKVRSVQVGDVVAFRDPATRDELVIVTHRVVDVQMIEGEPRYVTQGDANNTPDMGTIGNDDLIAEYVFHIEGLGNFAMFLREPIGMLLFIGVPVLAFILYDIIRHKLNEKKKTSQNDEMKAELERLRALAEQTKPTESDLQDAPSPEAEEAAPAAQTESAEKSDAE